MKLMVNIQLPGTTSDNWNEFTETTPGAVSPIKYIKRNEEMRSRLAESYIYCSHSSQDGENQFFTPVKLFVLR